MWVIVSERVVIMPPPVTVNFSERGYSRSLSRQWEVTKAVSRVMARGARARALVTSCGHNLGSGTFFCAAKQELLKVKRGYIAGSVRYLGIKPWRDG